MDPSMPLIMYKTSVRGDQQHCPSTAFVWRNFAPPLPFFGWVLTKDRIRCKKTLRLKNILQNMICDICVDDEELADHIISRYPFAKAFWRRVG